MNTRKLKAPVLGVAFLALAAAVVWQHGRAKWLAADADSLRARVQQAEMLREENGHLATQLQSASERSQAEVSELTRLRGQAARAKELEKENARLRADRDRSAKAAKPSAPDTQEPEETPEQRFQRAKGFFGRDLGTALLRAAEANGGNVPAELRGPLIETVEALSGGGQYDIHAKHFELVYSGSLRDVKDVSETVLAREKEPVQLANGQWVRLYVMADGSSRYVGAATPDAFAAREKELWPGQAKP